MPKVTITWSWDEAFDKFGFGDGDGLNFTSDVVAFLETLGYECECSGGMHNWMIDSVTKEGQTTEFGGSTEKDEDNPRKLLPTAVVKALDINFPN